jgi:hypothetical protein
VYRKSNFFHLGASGYADRALRGFRHAKIQKPMHGFLDFGATA